MSVKDQDELGKINSNVTFFGMMEKPTIPTDGNDLDIVVEDKMTLPRLAHKYYGDVRLWWVIALRNKIDLPEVQLYKGRRIVIPSPKLVRDRRIRK
jgi:hypothetical protein